MGWWRSFLTKTGKAETDATAVDVAEFFLQDDMVRATLATRLSCSNALIQYYREYHPAVTPNPFSVQLYPYPVLRRFVPAFAELYAQVTALAQPYKAYGLLLLLGRLRIEDVERFDVGSIRDSVLHYAGRCIPLKERDAQAIVEGWRRPSPGDVRSVIGRGRIQDWHGAVIAELFRRGVREDVVMAIYGRQSATVVDVAVRPVGLFRVPLPVPPPDAVQ